MFQDSSAQAWCKDCEGMLDQGKWSRSDFAETHLFGLSLVNASRTEIAHTITARAALALPTTINFVNAHCVNTVRSDPDYARCLQESDFLLPDGSGMRIASKMAGKSMGENLNGTDLFPELCERAARLGLAIYLLGGAPGTAAAAAAALQRRYPGLKVAGTQHGYFAAGEEAAVIARINRARPALLFVGFGVPLQEKWIARHRENLMVPVVLGVGGLFDYYSGNLRRAPAPIRAVGCEWAWRLMMEPRRLARRYLVGNMTFLAHCVVHAIRVRMPADAVYPVVKRMLDVTIALAALLILLPLLIGIAFAIRREDGGPIFFRQRRIGANGKPFMMLKFRSMVADAEKRRRDLLQHSERDAICFKMKRDPRITRVGALLRRASADELPQLLNVLSGDMSIVGPRPALADEVLTYAGRTWRRLAGKPGITCTWQVSGRAEIPFDQQVEMDLAYLSRRSIVQDVELMFRTIPAVVGGRGAY